MLRYYQNATYLQKTRFAPCFSTKEKAKKQAVQALLSTVYSLISEVFYYDTQCLEFNKTKKRNKKELRFFAELIILFFLARNKRFF